MKVSIIIPTYNSCNYINQAIESVLVQTYTNYEIIVVDDGSTDKTIDVLQPYLTKIRYYYQDNHGSASARNYGISKAEGKLIAFLDADDYWLSKEKLALQASYFNLKPSIGCVTTGWQLVDDKENKTKSVEPWRKAPELNLETWLKHKPILTSTLIIRREWLEKVDCFDASLNQAHDLDLILRLSVQGCEFTWLKQQSVAYRQHSNNKTLNAAQQGKCLEAVLDKFFSSQELSLSIRKIESKVRYETLVWLAWYQYYRNDWDLAVEYLNKSLKYTPYLKAETIYSWLNLFEYFAKDRVHTNDPNFLDDPRLQQLIVSTLTLTNGNKIRKKISSLLNNEDFTINTDFTKTNKFTGKNSLCKHKLTISKYQKNNLPRFPSALTLPPLRGENNNYTFIEQRLNNFVAGGKAYHLSVSIIIPVENKIDFLAKTLAAITRQTYPHDLIEVVVVNQEGNNELEKVVKKYQKYLDISIVKCKDKSLQVGAIYNLGIKAAKHDYLIILDHDMLPYPQLVEQFMKYFHVWDLAVLVGNRRFAETGKLTDSKILENAQLIVKLPNIDGNKKDWKRASDLKVLDGQLKTYNQSNNLKKDRYPFRAFTSCNFAISKKMIEDVGCFDDSFQHRGYQDKELGYRLFNAGYYFIPVLDALAVHQNIAQVRSSKNGKFAKQLFEQKCPVSWYRDYKVGETYKVPKVSIYIPSYNNGKFIKEAIDSVLNQTYTDLEVCICDDGSTDDTLKVLEKNYTNNPKVRWVSQSNGGIGKASNTAVRMCRGMYIGQLDSDDLLKPQAVETLVDYLDKNNVGCVYSSCERIDAQGNYLKDEYSYRVFSREKMLMTSIVHHFRMFRRRDWLRTEGFSEQLVNAVDYDMFLKLSEVCSFYHINEYLYLRRWHGKNTSIVNEKKQDNNTHVVITKSLERMGLADEWEVYAPDINKPREISFRRKQEKANLFFFPNYRRSNPYQNLLYGHIANEYALFAGDIGNAIDALKDGLEKVIFHLHWTNYILKNAQSLEEAQRSKNNFLKQIFEFLSEGGKLVWTVHNVLPHNCPYLKQEIELRNTVAAACSTIHVHSEKSIPEIQKHLNIPLEKVKIVPHGNYVGAYPNQVTQEEARKHLNFDPDETLFLFLGQVRVYKGIDDLLGAFAKVQAKFPKTRLLIAGKLVESLKIEDIVSNQKVLSKITFIEGYVPDDQLQYFYNAADVVVLPYRKILTSGSMLSAMSFSRPAIVPRVGMTEEIITDGYNGFLYQANNVESLLTAMSKVCLLDTKAKKSLFKQSFDSIQHLNWENANTLFK